MKLIDVPERHLPSDFADRLVRSIHHRRRMRLARLGVALALAGLLGVGLFGGFCCRETVRPSTEAQISAAPTGSTNDTKVTSLFMLGFFGECFMRNKPGRKEDDGMKEKVAF